MRLAECEIVVSEIRGTQLVVLFGAHELSAAEGAALLTEYGVTHGGTQPMYASPAGWQTLEPAAVAVPVAAPSNEPDEPASDPPPAKTKRK